MKTCSKCGEEKDLSFYLKDPRYKGGYRHQCKPCKNARKKQWQDDNPEAYRAGMKKRNNAPLARAQKRDWAKRNPEKQNAKKAVRYAVKTGRLAPASACECNDCGKPAQHLHHHSYEVEHRLDVVPLCASCHRIRHAYPERF